MEVCEDCGENAVSLEEENGQKVKVCLECGHMPRQSQDLTSDRQFVGTTISDGRGYIPKGVRSYKKRDTGQPTKGLLEGRSFLSQLGQNINFTGSMIESAESLFEKYFHDHMIRPRQPEREALAGACLLTIARREKIAISLKKMASYFHGLSVNKGAGKIVHYLTLLREHYDVVEPNVDSCESVRQTLQAADMPKEVIDVAEGIIECMENAMITQSRGERSLFVSAAFFAWNACYFQTDKKHTFKAMCEKFKMKCSNFLQQRKAEMQTALQSMVKELPWYMETKQAYMNFYPYLKDVIKYKKCLLSEAIDSKVREIEAKDEVQNNDVTGECNRGSSGTNVDKEDGAVVDKRSVEVNVGMSNEKSESDVNGEKDIATVGADINDKIDKVNMKSNIETDNKKDKVKIDFSSDINEEYLVINSAAKPDVDSEKENDKACSEEINGNRQMDKGKKDTGRDAKNYALLFRRKGKWSRPRLKVGSVSDQNRVVNSYDSDSDDEINLKSDDDDTDMYIVSTEEVQERKRLKMMMTDNEDEDEETEDSDEDSD